MSDNEYLSEEEEEEEEDEDEDEEEEENARHTTPHNNKGSKPLTPLTFGRTFTNQHRLKSTDGEIEVDEGEEEDEEDEEVDDDGIAEEDEDDLEEEEDEANEDVAENAKSASTSKSSERGKRKRSKKEQGSDSDSEKDEEEAEDEDDEEEEDDAEEEEEEEKYMHQFEKDLTKEYILETHPECIPVNLVEVRAMLPVLRNEDGIIVDDFHRTLPIVTKYEKARIIGQRAMQLNSGATPYIPVENLIDGTTIAELEFEQKKIPVIIKRPLPNGAFEYWRLKDLEILY
jgi:DNA-directed RNA polymerase subunit K/omega